MEGWQKVTFRLVKPYVLPCETYGLGLQKVWFCLWRVFDAFSQSFPLLFLSASVGCVAAFSSGLWEWFRKKGRAVCGGVRKWLGMWKFKGSQSFGGKIQGGETPFI